MTQNVAWQILQSPRVRWTRMGQCPVIAWLTGLPGSGKTSIADVTDRVLSSQELCTTVLDGDNLRHGLCRDLDFSKVDRTENVRRAAEVARLMAETGLITIVALISPLREERAMARRIAGDIPFLEVFIDTPLSTCENRDPKGHYALARRGKIESFTGISAPYERPIQPDLNIYTNNGSALKSAGPLIDKILEICIIK